jgi:hypothetical protein
MRLASLGDASDGWPWRRLSKLLFAARPAKRVKLYSKRVVKESGTGVVFGSDMLLPP